MAPSTLLLGLGNTQVPLGEHGKHSQTAEPKKAKYSAPPRALAIWRWKRGRRNCRRPIGQPYAATPHYGIACIGTHSLVDRHRHGIDCCDVSTPLSTK